MQKYCEQLRLSEFLSYRVSSYLGSNLLEAGRRPVRSQIPLRYLARSWCEAGRVPASSC